MAPTCCQPTPALLSTLQQKLTAAPCSLRPIATSVVDSFPMPWCNPYTNAWLSLIYSHISFLIHSHSVSVGESSPSGSTAWQATPGLARLSSPSRGWSAFSSPAGRGYSSKREMMGTDSAGAGTYRRIELATGPRDLLFFFSILDPAHTTGSIPPRALPCGSFYGLTNFHG